MRFVPARERNQIMLLRSTRKGALAALLALAFVAGAALVFASACGDDDAGSGDAEVINAINILDNAGLHGIDESVNDDQTIPASARTTAQKLQAVTELTAWPEELQDEADALAVIFSDLAAALDGESPDIVAAGEAAKKAHDGQHDFSQEVWAHLYEEAGLDAGEEGGH